MKSKASYNMTIQNLSGIYLLKTSQFIEAPVEDVWEFFSMPSNLENITPSKLKFSILSDTSHEMSEGDIISYKVKIFPFVKSKWVTEIKSVSTLRQFVDEQRVGPYKIWHHRHTFIPSSKGTIMTDEIHFIPPFKFLSNLLVKYSIEPRLIEIFTHRKKVVEQLFNSNLNS